MRIYTDILYLGKKYREQMLPNAIRDMIEKHYFAAGFFCIVCIVAACLRCSALPFLLLVPAAVVLLRGLLLRRDFFAGNICQGKVTCVSVSEGKNILSKTNTVVFSCEDGTILPLEVSILPNKPIVEGVKYILFIHNDRHNVVLAYQLAPGSAEEECNLSKKEENKDSRS